MNRVAGNAMMSKALAGKNTAATTTTTVTKRYCGLLAAVDNIWSPTYTAPSKAPILTDEYTLRAATGTMIHRGPDGRHTARGHLSEAATPAYSPQWVMGHQRLSIVDPDNHAADMPFLLSFGQGSEKKNVKLAANGEIYNHKILYDDIVNNHGWTEQRISASDCEVIAHACACLGPEEAVKRLDGMFAFCLFEEASEDGKKPASAFAARDPVGIKPLYYGNTEDGAYVFASELKALVGHVVPSSVTAIPPGHYWTPQTGLVRYHAPEWNFNVSLFLYCMCFLFVCVCLGFKIFYHYFTQVTKYFFPCFKIIIILFSGRLCSLGNTRNAQRRRNSSCLSCSCQQAYDGGR